MRAEKCVLFPVPLTFHTPSLSAATVLFNGPDGRPRAWCQRGPLGHRAGIQGSSCVRRPLAVLRYEHTQRKPSWPGVIAGDSYTCGYLCVCAFPRQHLHCESLLNRNAASLARLHFCSACQGGAGRGRTHGGQTVPLGFLIAVKHASIPFKKCLRDVLV